MTTCTQDIQAKIDAGEVSSIARLLPFTAMVIDIGIGNNQLFVFEIIDFQTADFEINLVPLFPPTSVGVVVTFYQLEEDDTFINLGSALITELSMNFQKDFSAGTYFVCISSQTFSYGGTFQGNFTTYPITVKFSPTAETGGLAVCDLTVPQPDRECSIPLIYEIVDGELPEGLTMTVNGNIEGILPNLDCIEYTDDLSPSQGWYFEFGNQWEPWGLQWRFKVKLWAEGFEENGVEQWFCIRVHNNWSWDKDHFTDNEPYSKTVRAKIQDEQIGTPIESICPPCEDSVEIQFEPEPTLSSPCDCDEESDDEARKVLEFLEWYNRVIDNPNNSPEVELFISNFRQSPQFADLMEKAGLGDELLTDAELESRSVNLIIRAYQEMLDNDGRGATDIDSIMIRLRDEENQKLPTTLFVSTGVYASFDLE
jgi:hypothetical protein